MKKILFAIIALAMTMALSPATATRAAAMSFDMPAATFYISQLGDVTIVLSEGMPHAIVANGQEFSAKGVYFSVNDAVYQADALLSSNLNLQRDTMPLKFDHEGTFDFTSGEDMLSFKYEGVATRTKDMAMHTKTLNSYGTFVITKGSGIYAGLEGAMGTYTMTVMCQRMPGEHPMVGDPVEVTFSAMSE